MEYVLYFLIGIPIGLILLVLSMVISSSISGGIEFGELKTVLLKSLPLLAVVYAIDLIPDWGWFLAIPVWWFGLMLVFGLDFWEVKILVIVNWVLNKFAGLGLFLLLQSLLREK